MATNFVAGQRLDQAQDKIREAQATLEAQRASVATAQAALEQARYEQEQTSIRAPADGRIARRYANPGAGASTLNVSTMFAFLRRHVVWAVVLVLGLAVAGGLLLNSQAKAQKAQAAKVAAAKAPKSPFVAIANGKADVEGGMIQVLSLIHI